MQAIYFSTMIFFETGNKTIFRPYYRFDSHVCYNWVCVFYGSRFHDSKAVSFTVVDFTTPKLFISVILRVSSQSKEIADPFTFFQALAGYGPHGQLFS